ncbi:SurA N-terminal domain-containing protein [Caldimonas tepidiphila]|uniref:SurA N-terminal domain-containing protein n=1 Tax=Caldimonas tepidiphila TaxID=2315841 RepID=UPI000E5BC982|nr:SurA N-terminal domain-containing protein [Caldimonas tepidiphila]
MFDFVRNNTRVLFFVLLLLIIPSFVFLGVQGYGNLDESGTVVANVGGMKITQAEWDNAHRTQIERMRAQLPNVDVKMLDTPEMRQQTLEALVRDRVMAIAAEKLNFIVTDERLMRQLMEIPQIAALRRPDGTLDIAAYNALLAQQGLTPQGFEANMRRELMLRQVMQGVSGSAHASKAVGDIALDAFLQSREVQVARFDPRDFRAQVNPTEAELEQFYADPANAALFQAPEQADIEYAVLDLDAVRKTIKVSDEELRRYYQENAARFSTPAERRASHILIAAERSAPAAERDKARAKAEELLAEIRRNPGSFEELARKHSQDPGSAANGGDLDFFGRGAMVQPFEEAAFGLKPGETSGIVETDFGFHIIRVTGARGGESKPFEAVRDEIAAEVTRQLAQQRYTEAAEQFSNMVYEQSDTLKPAADKLGLALQTASGVTRTPAPGANGPLGNARFLEELFSDETLRNRRNTEAIEIGPNQLAAARVLKHQPARKIAMAEVKDRVRELLVARQAAALARKEGEARLAAWKAEPAAAAALGAPQAVSRMQSQGLPRPLIEAALRAPAEPLPAWIGVDLGNEGYAVVRVNRIAGRDTPEGAKDGMQAQYVQAWAAAEAEAYYEALKKRFDTEVKVKSAPSGADAAR